MFVQTQGRKSTVKQPRTFRRNLRRGTSQPLRRSTATWLALLIQPIFNSCSTQSQMSLSPIIFVAAVSIEDKYSPVAEPIDRHTHIWLNSHSYPYTEHMCCIARTRERVRMRDYDNVSYWEKDWVTERERMAERTGEKEIYLCTTATTTDHLRIPSQFLLPNKPFMPVLSTFFLIVLIGDSMPIPIFIYLTCYL